MDETFCQKKIVEHRPNLEAPPPGIFVKSNSNFLCFIVLRGTFITLQGTPRIFLRTCQAPFFESIIEEGKTNDVLLFLYLPPMVLARTKYSQTGPGATSRDQVGPDSLWEGPTIPLCL